MAKYILPTILGVILTLILAEASEWVEIRFKKKPEFIIPTGLIGEFKLDKCPPGWGNYKKNIDQGLHLKVKGTISCIKN